MTIATLVEEEIVISWDGVSLPASPDGRIQLGDPDRKVRTDPATKPAPKPAPAKPATEPGIEPFTQPPPSVDPDGPEIDPEKRIVTPPQKQPEPLPAPIRRTHCELST